MKKLFTLAIITLMLITSKFDAQSQWRWGRHTDFERVDTVVSIPRESTNSILIGDDDFYLRMGFFGLEIEIEDDWDDDWRNRRRRSRSIEYFETHDHGTLRGLNVEFGFNNYLDDGEFPSSSDLYKVKPIGSNFVAINWNHVSKVTGPLYLDWGGGISWYNFKYENPATRLDSQGGQLTFVEDLTVDSAIKSKLKVTYLNFTAVPMFDFSKGKRLVRMYEVDDVRVAFSRKRGFRIGIGGYFGMRLSNKAKYVYKNDGNRKKDKDKGQFYVNDFRYGARLQMGINGFDFFVNYDLNELFEDNKGPKLNPVTFGVIF
jgi:hypothetical protein